MSGTLILIMDVSLVGNKFIYTILKVQSNKLEIFIWICKLRLLDLQGDTLQYFSVFLNNFLVSAGSVELTVQVRFRAGPPAVIAHITSAVRAVALLAVTACVPPLHPAAVPLLHLTADVWQRWERGGDHEKPRTQTSRVSVAACVKPMSAEQGTYATCPGDSPRPRCPLSTARLHRDPGCPWRSARTTRADVSWLCWPAAGNDGRHGAECRQQLPLPLPSAPAPYVPGSPCRDMSRFSCDQRSPAVSDPTWTWPSPPGIPCAETNASEVV